MQYAPTNKLSQFERLIMKYYIIILTLCLILISAITLEARIVDGNYISEITGLSFTILEGHILDEINDHTVTLRPVNNRDYIIDISTYAIKETFDLIDFIYQYEEKLSHNCGSINLISTEKNTISSYEVICKTYNIADLDTLGNVQRIKMQICYLLRGSYRYVFTYTSSPHNFDNGIDTFESLLNTIHFLSTFSELAQGAKRLYEKRMYWEAGNSDMPKASPSDTVLTIETTLPGEVLVTFYILDAEDSKLTADFFTLFRYYNGGVLCSTSDTEQLESRLLEPPGGRLMKCTFTAGGGFVDINIKQQVLIEGQKKYWKAVSWYLIIDYYPE